MTTVRVRKTGDTAPSHRRRDIQGLRALAVMAVVAFHAGLPVPGGFIGVDVFFVISGYVITGMLEREWSATGRIRFGGFYWRRFKRLTPALALMITVVMVASVLVLSPMGPQENAAKTAIGSMLLVANLVIARTTGGYFDAPAETNPLLNTWSLSVEEQFYFLFPALIASGWYLARRARILCMSPYIIVSGVALLSFVLAYQGPGLTFRGSGTLLGFYSPFTRAWEFAVGALLALVLARRAPQSPALLAGAGMLGLPILAAGLWTIGGTTPFPGPWTLIPVVATLLLLLSGTNPATPTSRLLSKRPMVRVGDWSYSIYLWHAPMIVFAVLLWPDTPLIGVIAALLSVAPALASYHWVERPMRDLQVASRNRRLQLVATTVLVPMGLALVISFTASQSWWSEHVRQLQAANSPHIGRINSCGTRAPLDPPKAATCVWNKEDTGPPVYMLGDSNADHFSEAFIGAGKALHRPVYVATTSACPFVDLVFRDLRVGADNSTCRTYVRQSLANLQIAQPGLVVISNSGLYWSSSHFAVGRTSGGETTDPSAKRKMFTAGLASTVRQLRTGGHQVLLIQTVPYWTKSGKTLWDPRRCTLTSVLSGGCTAERPLNQAFADTAEVRAIIQSVASQAGATIWDPSDYLCPDATCSTSGPGFIRYRDEGHISVQQANALTPIIKEVLARLR